MNNISFHAETRSLERGITYYDILTITHLVKPIYRTGIKFYYLREKDIPYELRKENNFIKLVGMTVLASKDGTIITTYRNLSKKALKQIKKKSKQRRFSA